MQRTDLDDYLAQPIGRWTSGEGWLHFCTADPFVAGGISWGVFGAPELEPMLRCATAALDHLPVHSSIMDGRRTRMILPTAYRMTGEYIVRHRKRLRERIVQAAGVRPLGLAGAIAEGFFRVVPAPYPVQVFAERGEALRWLGAEVHASKIDDMEGIALGSGGFVSELRSVLEEQLLEGSLPVAAKRLGISARSLQRRLRAEGTSFQRELSIVRIRAAQRMMIETDAPISRIAMEVGFGSPATFSVFFRRHEGESPREWRDRQKKTGFAPVHDEL